MPTPIGFPKEEEMRTAFRTAACAAALFVALAPVLSVPASASEPQAPTVELQWVPVDADTPRHLAAPAAVANALNCDPVLVGDACLRVLVEGLPATIPDVDVRTIAIQITEQQLEQLGVRNCRIHDLNTAFEIDHEDVGDLIVEMDHGTTSVSVYFPPGSCDATVVDAVFDDEATRPANACPASQERSYRSDDPLAAFDGLLVTGGWSLEVADVLAQDTGSLGAWGFAMDVSCDQIGPTGPCVPGGQTLCLADGRFQVEVDWRTNQGTSGQGNAIEETPDTGMFWFFDPANIELVVKVIDACSFAQRFWVFSGGLTNVEVEIIVTDTQTGQFNTYTNPLDTPFQPIQDTNAFATCP